MASSKDDANLDRRGSALIMAMCPSASSRNPVNSRETLSYPVSSSSSNIVRMTWPERCRYVDIPCRAAAERIIGWSILPEIHLMASGLLSTTLRQNSRSLAGSSLPLPMAEVTSTSSISPLRIHARTSPGSLLRASTAAR